MECTWWAWEITTETDCTPYGRHDGVSTYVEGDKICGAVFDIESNWHYQFDASVPSRNDCIACTNECSNTWDLQCNWSWEVEECWDRDNDWCLERWNATSCGPTACTHDGDCDGEYWSTTCDAWVCINDQLQLWCWDPADRDGLSCDSGDGACDDTWVCEANCTQRECGWVCYGDTNDYCGYLDCFYGGAPANTTCDNSWYSCEAWRADCNGDMPSTWWDGCEIDIDADDNNCGACGNVCQNWWECISWVCENEFWTYECNAWGWWTIYENDCSVDTFLDQDPYYEWDSFCSEEDPNWNNPPATSYCNVCGDVTVDDDEICDQSAANNGCGWWEQCNSSCNECLQVACGDLEDQVYVLFNPNEFFDAQWWNEDGQWCGSWITWPTEISDINFSTSTTNQPWWEEYYVDWTCGPPGEEESCELVIHMAMCSAY